MYRIDLSALKKKKNKTQTISGFKKGPVVAALKKSLIAGDVARSIQWTVELHMSLYIPEIWKVFLFVMSKHIHRENPLLPVYMFRQHQAYMQQLAITEPMNNQQCRNRVAEVASVLALSSCRPLTKIKFNKEKFGLMEQCKKYTLAPNIEFSDMVWRDTDCIDLKIPLNEFMYQLCKQDHTTDTQERCLFWLYWFFNWAKLESKKTRSKKSKNKKLCPTNSCARRINKFTDTEWVTDYIWMLWSACFHACKQSSDTNKKIIIQNLFRLFCHNYKTSKRVSKQIFLVHAVIIVLDTVPRLSFTKQIFTQYSIVLQSMLNINALYKNTYETARTYKLSSQHSESCVTNTQNIKQNIKQNIPRPHPYFDTYMNNNLFLDSRYNGIQPKKEIGLLGHLDKFFGW